jgi:large subunit ribosomal protein L22
MIEARATGKYVRTSAQKAGLVLALIRGREVNQALAALQFTSKGVTHDVAKVLRSAIANAQQQEGFGGDVDRLYVASCYANQGPSMKRTRPAPMGRGFRVVKRTAHLTVCVAERPLVIATDVTAAKGKDAAAGGRPGAAKKSRKGAAAAGKREAPGRGEGRGPDARSAKKE